jgi:HTH-type transcriptional regulator/antitoxin HigA
MLKVIKNNEEYAAALKLIEKLIDLNPEEGTIEFNDLELLSILISQYEEQHYSFDLPNPIEAIKFRMEQQNLNQKDLAKFIGSPSKVSEVLSGKRSLTLRMIRSLNKGLNIPAEVLLNVPKAKLLDDEIAREWSKFPFTEMYKRNYFNNFEGSLIEAKEIGEELIRNFLSSCRPQIIANALYRNNVRVGATIDQYSLMAWISQVFNLANQIKFDSKFDVSKLDKHFFTDLLKLSYFDEGPLLAAEFLKKQGIGFIYLRHLPKTHLVGASFRLKSGYPVVAMTLRYDRIDYFWFTLFHELSHIKLHFSDSDEYHFIDDLEIEGTEKEIEADSYAENLILSNDLWGSIKKRKQISSDEIRDFSQKLRIHPGIIAGRLRKENNDYSKFSMLVGNQQVRKLFLHTNS